ncbi:hypothetical protein ACWPMX_14370 [Tsuneonella sp. HG094]
MNKMLTVGAVIAVMLAGATGAVAKDETVASATTTAAAAEAGVPVYPYDITDRPYVIVQPIKKGIRKATIFSKEPSQEKIYNELWEKAQKLEADAVVNATYGDSHMTALSWGKTNALGIAVRFLTAAEIAAGKTGERAPAPETFTEEMFK